MGDLVAFADDQLKGFLAYLAFQGKAVGTREKYGQALRPFTAWLKGRTPGGITAEDVWLYLDEWARQFEYQHGREPKANTRRNQVTALKAFYGHLEKFDLLLDSCGAVVRNPMLKIDTPAAQKTDNDFLGFAEDAALLTAPITPQEKIVVSLLRYTGMRVGEACALKISDVHLVPGNRRIIVRRYLPMDEYQQKFLIPKGCLAFLIQRGRGWMVWLPRTTKGLPRRLSKGTGLTP